MRAYIVFGSIVAVVLLALIYNSTKHTFELASNSPRSLPANSTPAIASISPDALQIKVEDRSPTTTDKSIKSHGLIISAKRHRREVIRLRRTICSIRTNTKIFKNQLGELRSVREHKKDQKSARDLESAEVRFWESLMSQKHSEELLFLAEHKPFTFARRQRISQQNAAVDPHSLRLLSRQRQAQQDAAANP